MPSDNKLDFSKAQEFKVKRKDLDEFIENAKKEGDTIISVEYFNDMANNCTVRLIPAERTLQHIVNLLLDRSNEIENKAISVYKARRFTWDNPYCRSLAREIEEKTGMLVMATSLGPNSWDDHVVIQDKEYNEMFLHRDCIIDYYYDSSNQTQHRKLSYTQFKESRNKETK